MTAPRGLSVIQRDYRNRIIKVLDKVQAAGRRPSRIFEDWVDLTHANLIELPRHMQAVYEGKEHEDLPKTQELFERLRHVYKRQYFERFAEAQGLLFSSAAEGYMDVIGSVYMDWGWPSKGHGQFFTPLNVSNMMAEMLNTTNKPAGEIHERLQEAISKSLLASAMLMAGLTISDPQEAFSWSIARVIPPAMEHYEPITLSDPSCGSGIMFLSHASTLPWWMVQLGLVQYYGMDIDRLCVQMAQINTMLYGLNGRYAPYIVAHYDWLLRQGISSGDPGAMAEAMDEAKADDASSTAEEPEPVDDAPPPLQEKPGWNPNDFVQQSLFEPQTVYDVAAKEEAVT